MTKQERDAKEEWLEKQHENVPVSGETLKLYGERISNHLMQEVKLRSYSDEEAGEKNSEGNVKMFGSLVEVAPPFRFGAWCIETPFTTWSEVKEGKIIEEYVMLRTWSDQSLDRSIDINMKLITLAMGKFRPPSDMKFDVMTNTVICWLRLRGQFFWLERDNCDLIDPDQSMFFDNQERKLKLIASKDFKTWLHAHSGISPANSRMWNQIIEGVKTASTNPQISRGVKPGVLFDRRGDVIYVSCGPSMMAKVTKDGVTMVENGTDGVVFALGKTLAPWTLMDEKQGKNPFKETQIFGNANYASQYGQTILTLWFLGLASCIKNYPIILFQGRYRSGKTRCAQAVMELLGVPVRLNSIAEKGEEDFWALLNTGLPICFDNVDGQPVKWFPNAIQIASTGGSCTKRKMYTNDETVELGAKSKVILTANDPKFMTDSGVSDRILNVELLPFEAKNGKKSEDSVLTDEIVGIRSAAFTWLCHTISRALADRGETKKNLNRRHPDFAAFAVKCARALGIEREGVLAVAFAEFNKSYQTIVTDRITQMVFEVIKAKLLTLKDGEKYEFAAREVVEEIKTMFSEQVDEQDKQISNRVVGKVLTKHLSELSACFLTNPPKTIHGITKYSFYGFTDDYAKMMKVDEEAKVVENTEDPSDPYDEILPL